MDATRHTLDRFIEEKLGVLRPKHLYHYCDKDAAKSICERGVWCTNSNSLEDKAECKEGWGHAKNVLTQGYDTERIDCAREKVKELSVRFWIFSLCDDGKSAEMKSLYGAELLDFDYKSIHAEITELMRADQEKPLRQLHFLLPCFYLNQDKDRIERLANFIFTEYLEKELHGLYNDDEDKKLQIAVACSFMMDAIIKGEKFKHEKEWRMIVVTFGDPMNCACFGGKCRLNVEVSYRPKLLNAPIDNPSV